MSAEADAPPDLLAAVTAVAAGPYRVLARKYRPRRFEDLIGHGPMVRTLANSFSSGRIAQAWMLTGVRGVGKTTTARILARALNYDAPGVTGPTVAMPDEGLHCRAIMEGRHVDVIEIDAASHTGIDSMREIIDASQYKPANARYKVYIIDEVHQLSTHSFNALLKTLEEPPTHLKFIFATTEIRKVPITILSRCQRFDLRRVDTELIAEHLAKIAAAEGMSAAPEALAIIARAAEGSVRDSLTMLDQAGVEGAGAAIGAETVRTMLGLADRTRVIDLFAALMKGDVAAALGVLAEQYSAGADPAAVLADLAAFTHLVTRLKLVPELAKSHLPTGQERLRGQEFAAALSVPVLSRTWQLIVKGEAEVAESTMPLAAAEMVLVRIAYAADQPTPEEALRLLRDPGPAPPAAAGPAVGTDGGGASAAGQGGANGTRTGALVPGPGSRMGASAPAGPSLRSLPGGRQGAATAAAHAPAMEAAAGDPGRAMPAAGAVVAANAPEAETVPLRLEDLVAMARERRDVQVSHALERQVRLVRLDQGRLTVALTPDAPAELAGTIGRRLTDWTGQRWVVTVSGEIGAPTLHEQRAAENERKVSAARADPVVAAVLAAFPGAEIVDVRGPAADPAPDPMLDGGDPAAYPDPDDD